MAKALKGKAATAPFSPHIHAPKSLHRVMWDVVIALLPATFASVYFFGYHSVRIIVLAVITAVLTELLMNLMTKRDITVLDGSAVITGLLFAFNLPPNSPWYVVVFGSIFAIAIVKWAFGGLGQNIMNPALGARVFVLAAWSTTMINNWSPTIRGFIKNGEDMTVAGNSIIDAVSSASPLNDLKGLYESGVAATNAVSSIPLNVTNSANALANATNSIMTNINEMAVTVTNTVTNLMTNAPQAVETVSQTTTAAGNTPMGLGYTYWDMFIGNIPGCIGETSALALLIGFVYLVYRKVLFPVLPVIYIGTVALLTWMLGGLPLGTGLFTGDALYHILGGGLFLGAIFMATDYVTSPMTPKGMVIFGISLGVLTTIIRLWGGYPEGVSYSIVLMNLFVPIIDRYIKPKIYGTSKKKPQQEGGKA